MSILSFPSTVLVSGWFGMSGWEINADLRCVDVGSAVISTADQSTYYIEHEHGRE